MLAKNRVFSPSLYSKGALCHECCTISLVSYSGLPVFFNVSCCTQVEPFSIKDLRNKDISLIRTLPVVSATCT